MAYKINITKNKEQKEIKAEQKRLGHRTNVFSIVLLVTTILLVLYELLVSYETLKYAYHKEILGRETFLEGVVILFYFFPLMYAGFVFAILSLIAAVFSKNINNTEKPATIAARYISYTWLQITMCIPLAVVFLFNNDGANLFTLLCLTIPTIVCTVAGAIAPYLIMKKRKVSAKTISALFTTLLIVAIVEVILWILMAKYHILY